MALQVLLPGLANLLPCRTVVAGRLQGGLQFGQQRGGGTLIHRRCLPVHGQGQGIRSVANGDVPVALGLAGAHMQVLHVHAVVGQGLGMGRVFGAQVAQQGQARGVQRLAQGGHLAKGLGDGRVVPVGQGHQIALAVGPVDGLAKALFHRVHGLAALLGHAQHRQRLVAAHLVRVVVQAKHLRLGESALAQPGLGRGVGAPAVVAQLVPGLGPVTGLDGVQHRVVLHGAHAPVVGDGHQRQPFA